jgi:hypothetical protein
MTNRTSHTRLATAVLGAMLAAAACNSPQAGPRIPRTSATSRSTDEPPNPTTPPISLETIGPAPADLRSVDWTRVPLPGEFCAVPGLVTFNNNESTATSNTWGQVHLYRDPTVVYGDIYGDGSNEAAVSIRCDNGGGTADGQLVFAILVLASNQGRLIVVGTLTPQENPTGVHATLFTRFELLHGRVIAHETWYRPTDHTCCPTGSAVTVWTLRDGHLVPGTPDIVS